MKGEPWPSAPINGHQFITVASRRWCVGCDLFQQKRAKENNFGDPQRPCARDTNWAAAQDALSQSRARGEMARDEAT